MAKKTYNIQVSKFYDKTIQSPVLEIGVTDAVIELLGNFTIRTELKNTIYARKPVEENENRYAQRDFVKRYLIKSVLLNTLNDSRGWDSLFDLLFTPEIFSDKKIRIALSSNSAFYDIEEKTKNISFLISNAEKLLIAKKINVTINSEADTEVKDDE